MWEKLSEQHCVACQGDVPKLDSSEIEKLAAQVDGWQVVEGHHLRRDIKFKTFAGALRFVNLVGDLAEREGHHPDIRFGWGYAEIEIYTHAVGGLTKNDFILAAKINFLMSGA